MLSAALVVALARLPAEARAPNGAAALVSTAEPRQPLPSPAGVTNFADESSTAEAEPMDVARSRAPQQQQQVGLSAGLGTVVFIPFAGSLHGVKRATIAAALISSPCASQARHRVAPLQCPSPTPRHSAAQ